MAIRIIVALLICALLYLFYRVTILDGEVRYLAEMNTWQEAPPIVLPTDEDLGFVPHQPADAPQPGDAQLQETRVLEEEGEEERQSQQPHQTMHSATSLFDVVKELPAPPSADEINVYLGDDGSKSTTDAHDDKDEGEEEEEVPPPPVAKPRRRRKQTD